MNKKLFPKKQRITYIKKDENMPFTTEMFLKTLSEVMPIKLEDDYERKLRKSKELNTLFQKMTPFSKPIILKSQKKPEIKLSDALKIFTDSTKTQNKEKGGTN